MGFIASTSLVTDTAITVPNLSGGTNGKIVRVNGTNTVINASYNDTAVQLNTILLKQNNEYYAYGVVTGLSGLSPGSPYFVGSDGSLTATPPTPSSTIRVLYVGFALNTTDFLFRPGIPISGS
jgi:hypothetical protein